jgi:hypothetical protein
MRRCGDAGRYQHIDERRSKTHPRQVQHKRNQKIIEPQGSGMRPQSIALLDELIAAPDDDARGVILARDKAERALHPPRPLPTMPTGTKAPRHSLPDRGSRP